MRRLGVLTRQLVPDARPLEVSASQAQSCLATSADEYQPRSVLFTGGCGFIGSNVLIHMVQTYPSVAFVCLDNLSEGSNRANLSPLAEAANFQLVIGTITSEATVRSVMQTHGVDTVMHFAAQSHVDRSFVRPVDFSHTNVMGTAILLKVSQECGVQRFFHMSTDEVYGESIDEVFTEGSNLMPGNPYSASKAAAECLVRGYMSSFQMPIVMARPNNIYGPRQHPEKLIPKFIYRIQRKQTLPLHGGGRVHRSFLFVQDAAEAFDLILRKGKPGEVYNMGAAQDSTKSVKDVALALLETCGIDTSDGGRNYLEVVGDRLKNDAGYDVNSDKISALGWAPRVGFKEGLRRTVDWYLQNPIHWGSVDKALEAQNGGDEADSSDMSLPSLRGR